jgi:hypothetical protein
MSVNLYIDYMTAMLPSMLETEGKVKTYSIAFSSKKNQQPLVWSTNWQECMKWREGTGYSYNRCYGICY